jgi:biopolymer transport protein ExbB/TolQ
MLAPIANLTSYEPASLQSALGQMSGGMAVALYTTLAGLIGNILLRIQFQFLADAMQTLLLHVARDHEQGDDTHKEPSTK